jgi:hypothetical protein
MLQDWMSQTESDVIVKDMVNIYDTDFLMVGFSV